MSKFANGHVDLGFSLRDVLQENALEKDFSDLKRCDYKDWFVSLIWVKSNGVKSISDKEGKELPKEDIEQFILGIRK